MATINYNISSGSAPYIVSILPAVAPDNIHLVAGSYQFTSIPDGTYTITVTDNDGCTDSFIVDIYCDITTSTTTIEAITTTTTTLV